MRGRDLWPIAAAALLAVQARPAHAQPEQTAPAASGGIDRDALERRLTRRLGELDQSRSRLAASLDRLRAGADPEVVIKELGPLASPRREGPERGEGHRGPDADDSRNPRRVIQSLRERSPKLADRLEDLMRTHPEFGRRIIARTGSRLKEVDQAQDQDAQLVALRTQELENGVDIMDQARRVGDLASRKDADARELSAQREALRGLVIRQFDIRTKIRARQIENLAKGLESAKHELDERIAQREKIIERSMKQIEKGPKKDDPRRPEQGPPGPPPPPL